MNRKRAIASILLLGAGFVTTYSGYKWYSISKDPNLKFLEENKDLIADLAEVIIPRTNTPGAKDVKAQDAIITLIRNVADRKTQNNFIDGLKDLEQFSIDKYNKKFVELLVMEQQNVVQHFYEKGQNFSGNLGKAKNKILGKSFFDILKYYTTIAYCTSKKGATEALVYDYIPGKYDACIPLKANQRSWATK